MTELAPITVVIPVGPEEHHCHWLDEAIFSIAEQSVPPQQLLIIDDQAKHLAVSDHGDEGAVNVWRTPWLSGVAHSFNFGVALARNDLVIMMGSDDKLAPDCVERAWAAWRKHRDPIGYYWFEVEYSTGERQALPCHAAMVTKELWRRTGGYPPEAAVGAPDSIFMNNLHVQKGAAGRLYRVQGPNPLYWWRVHDQQETRTHTVVYSGPIAGVKEVYAQTWRPPTWTWIDSS